MSAKELDGFSRMAVESLMGYHDQTLMALSDPRSGIVAKCKFMPTIAEMLEFCEQLENERWRTGESAKIAAEQRRAIAAPTERDPQMLRRVVNGFQKLSGEIGGPAGCDRALSLAEAREASAAWLEREAQRSSEPLPALSGEALAALGARA